MVHNLRWKGPIWKLKDAFSSCLVVLQYGVLITHDYTCTCEQYVYKHQRLRNMWATEWCKWLNYTGKYLLYLDGSSCQEVVVSHRHHHYYHQGVESYASSGGAAASCVELTSPNNRIYIPLKPQSNWMHTHTTHNIHAYIQYLLLYI